MNLISFHSKYIKNCWSPNSLIENQIIVQFCSCLGISLVNLFTKSFVDLYWPISRTVGITTCLLCVLVHTFYLVILTSTVEIHLHVIEYFIGQTCRFYPDYSCITNHTIQGLLLYRCLQNIIVVFHSTMQVQTVIVTNLIPS